MTTYKFNIAESCCSGTKVTIYKIEENKKEVIDTFANFDTKEQAEEFAKKKVEEIKNGKQILN